MRKQAFNNEKKQCNLTSINNISANIIKNKKEEIEIKSIFFFLYIIAIFTHILNKIVKIQIITIKLNQQIKQI